jgi:hypothetical protein
MKVSNASPLLTWEPDHTLSMDVYLESMERIMADIVTLRFGVKSHDHKSSRSNQAHWQALLVLQYAYTGPPNKRVSVHSVVMGPRPDNVPEDWVIDHIDRDRFNNTGESSLGLANFNAFNAKRPDSGVSRFRGVHFVQSRRIASELKARCSHWQLQLGARGRNRFGNLLRTQVASGPKPATCCSLATNPRQALCSERACDIKRTRQRALLPAPMITTKSTGVDNQIGPEQGMERNIWGLQGRSKPLAVERNMSGTRESEWKAHESLTITYDSDGDAVIVLGTASGVRVKSKVDAELWHRLTFKTTWFLDRIGLRHCYLGAFIHH